MDDDRSMVIWFRDGNTAYFTQVTEFLESKGEVSFSYFGKETQVHRNAIFNREVIAGYALEVVDV